MSHSLARALALAATATLAVGLVTPPASAANVRYAAPGGSGTACTSAAPCGFSQAVGSAVAGDEVILAPGNYALLLSSVTNTSANLNIHSSAPGSRAVLTSTVSGSTSTALDLSGDGLKLSDVTLNHTTSTNGLGSALRANGEGDEISRVSVTSNSLNSASLGNSGTVRDSAFVNTGDTARAIVFGLSTTADSTLHMRNLTAIASGASSNGIETINGASTTTKTQTYDLRNVIASGTKNDIDASASGTVVVKVVFEYSNYDSKTQSTNASVTTPGTGTNQTAAPIFSDAAYREAPNSPTVDAGALDAYVGTSDLDGQARRSGPAIDIGAYEYQPPSTPPPATPPNVAPDTFFTKTPKHKTTKRKPTFTFAATEAATFLCRLDKKATRACASPYRAKAKTTGRHKLRVTAIDATGLADPTPVVFKWKVR